MKINSAYEKMINDKQSTLIVGVKKDESGTIRLHLNSVYPTKQDLSIYQCLNNIDKPLVTTHNLCEADKNKLRRLCATDPKQGISQIINLDFDKDFITNLTTGTNYILPDRFKNKYNNNNNNNNNKVISFHSKKGYTVYFVDDAIDFFGNTIKQLESRRIKDTLEFATKLIKEHQVFKLKLDFADDSDFKKENFCIFGKGTGILRNETVPTLFYRVSSNEDGVFNPNDIENINIILDNFVSVSGIPTCFSFSKTDLIVSKNCLIDVDGKDKYPEIVKKLWSYYNRGIK